ncbi:MAG: hypothetical protein ACRD1Q_12680, partial [Vicinamibacterales bacterium]
GCRVQTRRVRQSERPTEERHEDPRVGPPPYSRPGLSKTLLARLAAEGQIAPRIEELIYFYCFGRPAIGVDVSTSFDPLKYLARIREAHDAAHADR